MEMIPRTIIELANRNSLSQFEHECRTVINATTPETASDLWDFSTQWGRLTIPITSDIRFELNASEPTITPLVPNNKQGSMCHLDIMRDDDQLLHLMFMARESTMPCTSPIVLSNTRVSPNRDMLSQFNPYAFYDSLIYLMHRLAPQDTMLKLFVRQYDTRAALDNGDLAETTPLVKVFTKSGWKLKEHQTRNTSRRYPHVLSFNNQGVVI